MLYRFSVLCTRNSSKDFTVTPFLLLFLSFTGAMILAGSGYAAWLTAEHFAEYRGLIPCVLCCVLACILTGAAATVAVYPFIR